VERSHKEGKTNQPIISDPVKMNKTDINKTEREKMLANEPYIAADPELRSMDKKAQQLLYAFNFSLPSESEKRREIIRNLFGAIGQVFEVKPPFRCDDGCHIYAKENLYINYDCLILKIFQPTLLQQEILVE
jgi:Maltose acetyltransferase